MNTPAPDPVDALKSAWQASVPEYPDANRLHRLAQDTRLRAQRYDRAARARRVLGSAAFGLALILLIVLLRLPGVWLGMRIAMTLWAASLIACIAGLWRVRSHAPDSTQDTLATHLQASLRRLDGEIAYHRSLRWRFWLPFGVGLLVALLTRLPRTPDITWLLPCFALVGCGWGFVHGPRHWPARLQPEADALRRLLDGMSADPDHALEPRPR